MGSERRVGLYLFGKVGAGEIHPVKVQRGLIPSSTSSSFLPHLFEPASDMQTEPPIIVFSFIDFMYLYCFNTKRFHSSYPLGVTPHELQII